MKNYEFYDKTIFVKKRAKVIQFWVLFRHKSYYALNLQKEGSFTRPFILLKKIHIFGRKEIINLKIFYFLKSLNFMIQSNEWEFFLLIPHIFQITLRKKIRNFLLQYNHTIQPTSQKEDRNLQQYLKITYKYFK